MRNGEEKEMSYCRFSSDNFESDFYIFRSNKYEVVIATNRIDQEISNSMTMEEKLAELAQAFEEERPPKDCIPIDAPYAGDHRVFDTPGEAADFAVMVSHYGYHLPEKAVVRLREEQEELDRAASEV